jgi:hypothetical protein
MIECRETGIVYRNPKPYLRAIHAWHPSIVRMDDGELIASFDLGQAVESLDYRTYLARSADDGHTWSEPTRLFEDTVERRTTHTVRLSRAADETLIAAGARLYRDDPELGLINRENLGYTAMDLIMLTSDDRGTTWSGPTTIEPPMVGPGFETCHRVVELSDGRWILPTSTWKGWDGDAPNGMDAILLVSPDRGRTWPEAIRVMAAYDRGIVHWEQSVVELPDGRLLSVAWAVEESSGRTLPTPFAVTGPDGRFGPPCETGLTAQTAKIIRLTDGRILCLYRNNAEPGLWTAVVRIDGDQWITLENRPIWQGATSGMEGNQATGEELSELRFGYPSMVELPDGDVLAVFWCMEDYVQNIRWMRLNVAG